MVIELVLKENSDAHRIHAGMTNVVRFPLEVRVEPSLELLLDIAPDCREVDLVAEAFDLDRRLHEARGAADWRWPSTF